MQRQPVHTVYGGAHLFKADVARSLGAHALKSLQSYAADADEFGTALGVPAELRAVVHARVIEKLQREPVEDYRIDFEDGYGYRPDAEEDRDAVRAAEEFARGELEGAIPPFCGIRIKPLTAASRARSARTLNLFLTTLYARLKRMPDRLLITLPKITSPAQVTELIALLQDWPPIRIELMIETPESIFDSEGRVAIPELLRAAGGRCFGLHFGPYDYTASCEITAAHQSLNHPACDFARAVMLTAGAGRGVMLSDGPTTILPIPPKQSVHHAWRVHFEQIQRALRNGFYQGWDLHPAQLPARYAAVYAFFLESLPAASTRLRNFVENAARATRVGAVFDDAATGRGLLNFFQRGVNCGALSAADVSQTGLTIQDPTAGTYGNVEISWQQPRN